MQTCFRRLMRKSWQNLLFWKEKVSLDKAGNACNNPNGQKKGHKKENPQRACTSVGFPFVRLQEQGKNTGVFRE